MADSPLPGWWNENIIRVPKEKHYQIDFVIQDVNLPMMALLYGPDFWDWYMQREIQEWENEGGYVRDA